MIQSRLARAGFVVLGFWTAVVMGMPNSDPVAADYPSTSPSTIPLATAEWTNDRLRGLSDRFFDAMMVPNNLVELHGIASKLFSENCTGRVDASRKFLGRTLNTEYVFGGFTGEVVNASRITVLGMPQTHHNMHWAGNVEAKSAFVTELVSFNITTLGVVVPVQLDVWFRWNDDEEVDAYDATFRWVDWLFDELLEGLRRKAQAPPTAESDSENKMFRSTLGEAQAHLTRRHDEPTGEVKEITPGDVQARLAKKLAGQVCETAMNSCQGELQQYNDFDECMEFLTGGPVRFGRPYEFGRNTLLCRSLHEGMLRLKPEDHCPHVGPTGGNLCVDDMTYGAYAIDPDFFDKRE